MQPQHRDIGDRIEEGLHPVQGTPAGAFPGGLLGGRDVRMPAQPTLGGPAQHLGGKFRAMHEATTGPEGVQPSQEAADPPHHFGILQLRRPPRFAWAHAEAPRDRALTPEGQGAAGPVG